MESYHKIHRARLSDANIFFIFLPVKFYNAHMSWYALISREDYIDTTFLPRLLCIFNQIMGKK